MISGATAETEERAVSPDSWHPAIRQSAGELNVPRDVAFLTDQNKVAQVIGPPINVMGLKVAVTAAIHALSAISIPHLITKHIHVPAVLPVVARLASSITEAKAVVALRLMTPDMDWAITRRTRNLRAAEAWANAESVESCASTRTEPRFSSVVLGTRYSAFAPSADKLNVSRHGEAL